MLSVDLNCDLGESTHPAQIAVDLALLEVATSANIACGGHAGDESTMAATVEAALARGVAIGAHPGYPDRANFGRIALAMTPAEIEASVFEQITALDRIVRAVGGPAGARLTHVKTHGALYHRAMHDEPTALAIAMAVNRFDSSLMMVAMPLTVAQGLWPRLGFTLTTEFFADRVYEPDGTLRNREFPGSLITDPRAAADQAVSLVKRFTAGIDALQWPSPLGLPTPVTPPVPKRTGPSPHARLTICIHSDTPQAVTIAAAVRAALEHAGVRVCAPDKDGQ